MKQKYKPNHQQTGVPPHSAFPIREKTNNKQKLTINLTLYEAHTNHWTNLGRAETKREKEFNLLQENNSNFLEAWEKETSNTITLKKNGNAEKYCTNIGTNQKHRSPNK